MKKLLVAMMLVAFVSTIAFAAAPDSVTRKAKNGDVTFSHKVHAEKNACTLCHADAKGGKVAPLGKDAGHALCLECHKKAAAGPTKCGDCHKK